MSKEEPKFRPNEPEEWRAWQENIADRFGVEHDSEFFYVRINRGGKEETYKVPKHSGPPLHPDSKTGKEIEDWSKMIIKGLYTIKGFDWVSRGEVIEAIQKIYPEMEQPNIKEAILELRKRKGR